MMFVRWLALLAGFALAACSAPAPTPPPSPALWEISGPRGDAAGWLFGTVHALPESVDWRSSKLEQALGAAQVLVVEVGNIVDTETIGAKFRNLATDEAPPPLAKRLSPDLLKKLLDFAARDPGLSDRLDRLETWAVALTVARLSSPAPTTQGVDANLIGAFRPRPVRELEGATVQLELFDALPEGEQRDLLAAVIADGNRAEASIPDLIDAWRSGDLSALEQETRRGMLADPELRDALLIQRNRAWADRVSASLKRGEDPFVAVGAAHLVGPDGLIALLEARGYRLRRIQ